MIFLVYLNFGGNLYQHHWEYDGEIGEIKFLEKKYQERVVSRWIIKNH